MNEIIIPAHIHGLIFDCDGTLVDSMPLHMRAWKATLSEFGVNANEDFLFSSKGMKEIDIVSMYNNKFATNLNPAETVSVKQNFIKKHLPEVKPIEAVVKIAKQHYKKLPLAVASGSARDIVIEELKITGIIDLFDVIVTADEVVKPKPEPDIFLEAARLINITPSLCQVFEDGDPGLIAAEKAGMLATDVRPFIS